MARLRKLLVFVLALAAIAGGGAVAWWATSRPSSDGPSTSEQGALYQCSMHPEIVSTRPGNCPICGMPLQRIDDAHAGRIAPAAPVAEAAPLVAGRAGFALSPERQQKIGVRTAPVERRSLEATIRAAGRIAYDPALVQAVTDYREAVRAAQELAGSGSGEARAGADGLLRASRLRLRQLGVDEAQARELVRTGTQSLLLPGKSAWVYAQVYDVDAALVRPGQRLAISGPALKGRTLESRVASIDPIVDPTTRTTRVRALVDAGGMELRPESFVSVRIYAPLGEAIAVPAEAVVDTGAAQIAFVVRDGGRFEPRAVTLGREAGGLREVLSGLAVGEEVVTSANFLIDSESRFRAAAAQFAPGRDARTGDAATARAIPDGESTAAPARPEGEPTAPPPGIGHVH
jgi:Cu(I)/Ag(I) efflux system membrane fusion protein